MRFTSCDNCHVVLDTTHVKIEYDHDSQEEIEGTYDYLRNGDKVPMFKCPVCGQDVIIWEED